MYKSVVFPILSRFDAETVHERTLRLAHLYGQVPLLSRLVGRWFIPTDPRLRVQIASDLWLRSPVGMAAGFDKFGLAPRALNSLGFSHVEEGTVPPVAQMGNPKPRVFRLKEDRALINRMGFNSPGAVVVDRNLSVKMPSGFVIGISIGANKISVESEQAVADYVVVAKQLAPRGQYIAVNVSSPNTPGLRDLQHKEAFATLLDELLKARTGFFPDKHIFVKISPDLTWEQLDDVLEVILERDIQGVIGPTTTTNRLGLFSANQFEAGGLSGRPLAVLATEMTRYIYKHTEKKLTIIGCGGIFNATDALTRILNGATAVQVWTGAIYEGPLIAHRINQGFVHALDQHPGVTLQDWIGESVK